MSRKKAVFLDRDGTLIKDGPYLSDPNKIQFLPGVVEALQILQKNGFLLILITNQSGVGRGYFSEETVQKIHLQLTKLLGQHEVRLDAIYYCPHAPEAGCECRKPKPGLFMKAVNENSIDATSSFSVGDKVEDALAAKQIGCKTILLGDVLPSDAIVDCRVKDLKAAADWILQDFKK